MEFERKNGNVQICDICDTKIFQYYTNNMEYVICVDCFQKMLRLKALYLFLDYLEKKKKK